ncbi:starch-binding protein [Anaerosporobacter sp.]
MKNQRNKRMLYSICAIILSVVMVLLDVGTANKYVFASTSSTSSNSYELVDNTQDASILHCWNWSYKTIEDNMQLIAECGYSALQTSPATQPKDYTYAGVVGTDVGTPGYGGTGNWWKLYQPVTESVCDNGQTWLGTKAELESMCETAEDYGIKVIVDVVANHMGNITGWKNSLSDVSLQVGEYWNKDMLTDASFWHINSYQVWMSDSRLHFTMGTLGMPDLNTADKRVQAYISNYLKELIDCGVDGYRFDAAKHIETPDDDPAYASDFWPTVLGEARSYYKSKTGGDLYVYGEILNTVGDNFSINSYTKYMSVTDNSAGNHLLEAFRNNNVNTLSMDYAANVSVLWAESHDTYMNESARYASDKSIVRTWAMVANKDNAAKLFFVRPYNSVDILEGDVDGSLKSNLNNTLTQATMGTCATYTWASKEVAAINHFNNRMVNNQDNMGTDGNIAYCVRGNGMVLANFNGSGQISMSSHGMADGTYTDEVSRNTFTVANGVISGSINSEYGIAVIYKNVMPNPSTSYPVQISASVGNGTNFYGDSLNVTIEALYADSATYSASTGESGSFSGSKTINIGKSLSIGESVTLTVTGTNSRGKVTQVYTYTKNEYDMENCIFFKNTSGWSTVTAYAWNDTVSPVKKNASWPGEKMFECDSQNGIYALKIDPDAGYTKIIFSNNGSSQTKDLTIGDIGYLYNMSTGEWELYYEESDKTPTIVASQESSTITAATDITFSVKDAEYATYSLNGNDPISFVDSVTVTVGDNLEEGETDTVEIYAENGTKTKTVTYQYTMDYTEPVVTASVSDGTTFTDSLDVKFTVTNASTATISDGATTSSFEDSISVTATDTTTYTIVATKGDKNYTFTYTYTKDNEDENYIYLNVSACSWFGNDSAVAVSKFNNESEYTKCEKITYNNTVYYKALVPEGATSVTIARMIPNGNIYNNLTISLVSEKNVWTSNSSFNSGNWTYSSEIGTTSAN